MSPESASSTERPSYFLISVSTRENLELCVKHGLAGFPSGESGAWTFCEIQQGDFVSFLYGARAHNLYKVAKRAAMVAADRMPPWKPLTFKESGKTYSFPFRLQLEPIRTFIEPIVRTEFFYVAENLLLRGGYRKTHFQADQTTLQSVSQMGTLFEGSLEQLLLPEYSTFEPSFTHDAKHLRIPEVFKFQETILQAAIRHHLLGNANLASLLKELNLIGLTANALEVLSEKALPQGHIDLLLKQRVPLGSALKIPLEIKLRSAQAKDVLQLREYMDELLGECPTAVLVAAEFSKRVASKAKESGIKIVRYSLRADLRKTQSFDSVLQGLVLQPLE